MSPEHRYRTAGTANSVSTTDLSNSSCTTATHLDVIYDFLVSNLNITISGACGPHRTQPLECYYPDHRSYNSDTTKHHAPIDLAMEVVVPGGTPRLVDSAKGYAYGKYNQAVVYDRDIVTTWRLPNMMAAYEVFFWEKAFENAVGQGTMFCVIETFVGQRGERIYDLDTAALLLQFGDFLKELGTQPITITMSSVIKDMIRHYASVRHTLTGHFTWETCGDLGKTLEEFCLTRQCWFYPSQKEAALEVTFDVSGSERRVAHYHGGLAMHYSWAAPVISFQDLSNIVIEDRDFMLKPCIGSSRPFSAMSNVIIEYYCGPSKDWLHWDSHQKCFRGRVPQGIASLSGVERQSTYTIPLELTATVTTCFPGGIRHECVMRCALPLTVKRRPDTCWTEPKFNTLPSPFKALLGRRRCDIPVPNPGTSVVEVRMIRDMQLDAPAVTEASISHRKQPVATSPEFWTSPVKSKRQNRAISSHRSSSSTVMRTPSRRHISETFTVGSLHINRRGELDDDSDTGSVLDTPQPFDIILSPYRKSARQVDPRAVGGIWHSTAPIRLKIPSCSSDKLNSPSSAPASASYMETERALSSPSKDNLKKPSGTSKVAERKHHDRVVSDSQMSNEWNFSHPSAMTANRKSSKRLMAASGPDTSSNPPPRWADNEHRKTVERRSISIESQPYSQIPAPMIAKGKLPEPRDESVHQGQIRTLSANVKTEQETIIADATDDIRAKRMNKPLADLSDCTGQDLQVYKAGAKGKLPESGGEAVSQGTLQTWDEHSKAVKPRLWKSADAMRETSVQSFAQSSGVLSTATQRCCQVDKAEKTEGSGAGVTAEKDRIKAIESIIQQLSNERLTLLRRKCANTDRFELESTLGLHQDLLPGDSDNFVYAGWGEVPRSLDLASNSTEGVIKSSGAGEALRESPIEAAVGSPVRRRSRHDTCLTPCVAIQEPMANGATRSRTTNPVERWQRDIQRNYAEFGGQSFQAVPRRDSALSNFSHQQATMVSAHDTAYSAVEDEMELAERWQREIQDNYSEFEHKKWLKEGEDVTMLDASILEASSPDFEGESD